jgi:cellulose synthase/poly-beta-1,6-N-acetylglucosamine synthase-like glycosyltransferase
LVLSWVVYPGFIALLGWIWYEPKLARKGRKPLITVIIAVFNEEANIKRRIENLRSLEGGYPLEIVIGSDGSTDNTVEVSRSLGYPEVKVFVFEENRGRAMVHNDCVVSANGEIVLFTDAETIFEKDFLENIIPHFEDPSVGAVSGRIFYLNEDKTDIGRSAGLYWKYEERLRVAESRLGIFGFGTGAALAMRKEAYRPIGPTEDVDYAATLEAAAKGYKVLYEPRARAYDYISETPAGAFKTRIRQTSRCFKSVLRRIFSTHILQKRPSLWAAALVHKTFRHLSPFFMATVLFTNFLLLGAGTFYICLFFIQLVFYGLAIFGYLFDASISGPVSGLFSLPYNFTILNISRGIGVILAVLGKDRATYRTIR